MSAILDAVNALALANTIRSQIADRSSRTEAPDRDVAARGYPSGVISPGQMFNAKGNVFSAPGQLSGPVFNARRAQEMQQQRQDIIDAGKLARNIPNPTIAGALGLVLDKKLAEFEKQNPSSRPTNPLAADVRNRYSLAGQLFSGLGYLNQPGLPTPNLLDRTLNAVLGRDTVIPAGSMFNAKGNVFTNVGPQWDGGGLGVDFTSGGFETTYGGGDTGGPSEGMDSYGGFESAVGMEDRSGYA